ncbi:MAG TPA: hypothetical protein VGM84_19210 [Steroidobacteraceae bacterium]|jgi:hypothetical protein
MRIRSLALGAGVAALISTASVIHAPAVAANAAACDGACLTGIAEKYLAGLLAHDASKAPIAKGTRYSENNVDLPLPDGLWRTVDSLGKYRLYVPDPKEGSIGFFAKATEQGAPVLVATRLKVVNGQITEIESIVPRLGATVGGGPSSTPRVDQLGDAPRKQFTTPLPADKRRSREQMIKIANTYFTGIETNTGDKPPEFAKDCLRLENGSQTSGLPTKEGATPGSANFGCIEAFRLGYYREDTRLRNRRVLAIDEEHGLVYTGMFIDHDATLHSYKLKDGRTNTNKNTAAWTWAAQELFQIDAEGKISQVEAVLLSVPYGMRPAFGTGVHLPSPAAQKDGFKEY